MATTEDLQAAADAVSKAVTDLVAKATADAASAPVVPDFQGVVDTLNAATAAAEAYVNPAPAA